MRNTLRILVSLFLLYRKVISCRVKLSGIFRGSFFELYFYSISSGSMLSTCSSPFSVISYFFLYSLKYV